MNATEMIPLKSGSPVKLYSGSTNVQTVAPKTSGKCGPFLVTPGHTIGVIVFGTAMGLNATTGVVIGLKTLAERPTDDKFRNSWEFSIIITTAIVSFCSLIGLLAVFVSSFRKKRALDNAQRYVRIGS